MKKLAGALIVVIVAVVGATVATHVLIDQDAMRARISEALRHQTGLSMQARQSSIQLLPWPSFEATGVVLGRSGEPALLKAGAIHAGVSLLPLLHREVRFQDFTIDDAAVSLDRDAQGRASWSITPDRADESGYAAPAHGDRVHAHWDLSLDALHVTNTTLHWDDVPGDAHGAFRISSLDLAGLRSPSPWINLLGNHAGTPFSVQGHFGGLAQLHSADQPWAFSLGTTFGDAPKRDWMNIEGHIRNPKDLQGVYVTVQGEWSNLQDMHRLFPHAGLPDMPGLGGQVDVEGDVGAVPFSVRALPQLLKQAQAGLSPTRIHVHAGGVPLRHTVLENVHVDADAPTAPLTASADVEWKNTAWQMQGRFGTLVQAVSAWQDHLQTAVPVQVELRNQSLSFSSAFSPAGAHPPINGEDDAHLTLTGSVGAQNSHLDVKGSAPLLHLPKVVLHDVGLGGTLDSTRLENLSLDGLAFSSQEASLDGGMTLVMGENVPPLATGHFHFGKLDLDALQNLWTRPDTSAASAPSSPVALPGAAGEVQKAVSTPAPVTNDAPVASAPDTQAAAAPALPGWVRRLRRQDMNVRLEADQVILAGRNYSNLNAHLTLSGGHLRIDPIAGQGLVSPLSGQVDLNASQLPVTASLTFQPVVVPAGLLASQLGFPVALRGPVEVVGQLSGSGETPEDLRRSLSGHLGLSMVDGDVDSRLLGRIAGPKAGSLFGDGVRKLRCIGVHMTFADDTALIDTLGLQSGRFSTTGRGSVNLGTQQLNLHMLPAIDFAGADASTPMLLRGTISAPEAQQDRTADGHFQLTIGGQNAADPCPMALAAAREGQDGPAPAALTEHRSRAGDILRALGVLH
ncbi:AsmA family protein [Gluconobacter morbifer]|uniref:AsmA domain-containing protein n=1 Tax=Gluconobacter morbifer G707 TaxID=1088869 RepID=G6XFU3_9PROT|nr:AsmA family protein [Gluconobacter morbifer]EHH69051.1 hypothetical protein GMO_03580 [Gluconobacter morbifer G707]